MKVQQLGEFIRKQRQGARISLQGLSQLAGVSKPYLSQIERGLRRPSADIIKAIAKGLRISSQSLYVQAGILDREARGDVHTAILDDRSLTEQQKQVLLQVYESFREETERRRAERKPAARLSTRKVPSKTGSRSRKAAGTAGVPRRTSASSAGGREAGFDRRTKPAPGSSRSPASNRTAGSKRKEVQTSHG
jgi:transcriptional regulator with XRE-family HTH domain